VRWDINESVMQTSVAISISGLALTIIGWIVASRLNHSLAKKRENHARERSVATARNERKRNFRAIILSVRDSFGEGTTPDEKLFELHQASTPRIRDARFAIQDDIPENQQTNFRSACEAYLSLTRDDIENRDWSKKVPLTTPPARYELGRARLRQLLDQILEHAK
jgi:hypothetical protein